MTPINEKDLEGLGFDHLSESDVSQNHMHLQIDSSVGVYVDLDSEPVYVSIGRMFSQEQAEQRDIQMHGVTSMFHIKALIRMIGKSDDTLINELAHNFWESND